MGAFLGAQELQNIFVISQFLTIISHWRKVEGVVALVGREQGICKFGSNVYNFLVVFLLQFWSTNLQERMAEECAFFWSLFCCNFSRQICTKGWLRRRLWVGGGGGGEFPREFGLIPPIKSFSRPPRSFLNLLVSVSEVYRGDENFLHRWKQKLRTTPILRESGPARTQNNDFQQKHIRVVLR